MTANEDVTAPESVESTTDDQRAIPGSSQRRKPKPITIDLEESTVRIETPAAGDRTAETTPEPVPTTETNTVEPEAPTTEPVTEAHAANPDDHPAAKSTDEAPVSNTVSTAKPSSSLIAASLLGGAIGLIAAYGLASLGLWPGSGNTVTTAQLAALESRLAATESKVGPNGDLAAELAHLKSLPSIPGVTISDVEKILDPFTAKTAAAVAHMDDIDRKIAGEQAIVRGEAKAGFADVTTKMSGLAAATSDAVAQVSQLKAQIEKIESAIATLDRKVTDQTAAAKSDFSATIQSLGARVTELDTRTAADLAVLRGTTHEISERAAKSEMSIETVNSDLAATRKLLTDEQDRLGKLQAQIGPIDDIKKAVDGLGARIGAVDDVKTILAQQTAKLSTADDAKKAADGVAASLWIMDQRMATIQARLTEIDTLKAAIDADSKLVTALQSRVAPVESKIAGLDGYAKQGLEARKDAVVAIAVANLKTAADSGAPFANELKVAKAVAGDAFDLSALDVYAAKGLISETKLIEGFDAAARRIADTQVQTSDAHGILGTLLSHAAGSVKVTPVNAAAGDGVAERISRINAKLAGHDLAGALGEWQALPEAAQTASNEWGTALKRHVDGMMTMATISDKISAKLTSVSQ